MLTKETKAITESLDVSLQLDLPHQKFKVKKTKQVVIKETNNKNILAKSYKIYWKMLQTYKLRIQCYTMGASLSRYWLKSSRSPNPAETKIVSSDRSLTLPPTSSKGCGKPYVKKVNKKHGKQK